MIKVRIYSVSSEQGITRTKINRKVTLQLDVMFMKTKSFANFQLKISKHVGGKCGKLCISNILSSITYSIFLSQRRIILSKNFQLDQNINLT